MSSGCNYRFQDLNAIPELPIFNLESVELPLVLLVSIIDLIDGISQDPVGLHQLLYHGDTLNQPLAQLLQIKTEKSLHHDPSDETDLAASRPIKAPSSLGQVSPRSQ